MVIVQLGSNKGNDKLTEYIKNNNINLELGLFVEAIPFHIDELKECYKDYPNAVIENNAIKLPRDEKTEMVIYYHLDDGPKYEVASFDKNHILKHYTTDNIESIKVPSMTLEEILDKHNITKIDWLLIDVEGLDAEIVETFNWSKYDIDRVDVEHIHWGIKRDYLFQKFYDMGYKHVVANDDRYDVAFEKIIVNDQKIEHFYQNIGEDWFGHSNFYSEIVNKFPDDSHFVEVGVWKGRGAAYMATEIINSGKKIKFDCVDNWEYSDLQKDIPENLYENLYETFLENVKPVKHMINPIKLLSHDASKLYENNSLDFVFIDAAHDYENVKRDIESWLPKIKVGGILAGHDYETSIDGVKRAVDEVFKNKEITNKENCWIYEKKNNMKNYKVIDTFIFGGELEILKMRLDYLYDSVDYFVFSEANKTHTGEPKELTFLSNIEMFESYKDKIHYVIYEPDITNLNLKVTPEDIFKSDLWKLERTQRNQVHSKVMELSDQSTMILHSDCDEFPDKTKFDELREMTKDLFLEVVSLEQPTYYYSPINLLEMSWYGTVAFNHQTLINLSDYFSVRENRFQSKHLENAGWHFSFFATPEKIKHKIQTYTHQEYNTPEIVNIETIKNKIYNGLDVLNRSDVKINKLSEISSEFPMEFHRHELFFKNTFDRGYLKPQQVYRKNISMQIPLEIENLQLTVTNHNPKVIVEIGTANGGTLARWLEIPSSETIISIDYPVGIHGGQGFEERTYVISDAVEQSNLTKKEFYAVNGNSKDPYLINRVNELLNGRKIDFLFIDGDHTYEGVKGDFEIYKQFLSDDAIVGFHDIINSEYHIQHNCYVSKFWNELKEEYECKEFIHTEHIDLKMLPHLGQTKKDGGFGGIGLIEYRKKKDLTDNLSIIVPIYGNVDDTINNLNITLSHSKNVDDVILYSNGTDDEGVNKLKNYASFDSRIKLFTIDKPIGFVKAVNESLKKTKNEFILCLNSDAHLFGDWENRLLPLFKNDKYGVVGPVMARDFILGCCFGFKKSVINKIGMLDEGFGLGYEDDVEYSERVKNCGYELGYCEYKDDFGWNPMINFPIYHKQGDSFNKISNNIIEDLVNVNSEKRLKFKTLQNVTLLKNLNYEDVLPYLETNDNLIVINKSGSEFEKIRNDENIIRKCRVFEITSSMDINQVIDSLTKGKSYEIVDYNYDEKISLVVPIFNNVEIAIDNINTTLQSSKRINEVILFSNGTSDEGNSLLTDFANSNKNIKLYFSKNPIGFVKAVNESFKLCTNELILCLNSDANLYYDWEDKLMILLKDSSNGLIGPVAVNCNTILGCCFIIRKSLLNKIGMLNEGLGMGYFDDADLSFRVTNNGLNLGYHHTINSWDNNTMVIDFPFNHSQGLSFSQLNIESTNSELKRNEKKLKNYFTSNKVLILKDLTQDKIKSIIDENGVYLVVNNSGEEFEKIRYDEDIVSKTHIFECTNEMNIDVLIDSLTKNKEKFIIDDTNYESIKSETDKLIMRYDIINSLIKKNNYKSYLEIGVRIPDNCFDLIECETKHGVDPMVEVDYPVTFKLTSDDFFDQNTNTYDIIFIDGLHLDYQVEKDIINSLKILNDGGTIVLHDCNPPDVYHQRENYYDITTPANWGWTGTVWKAVVKVKSEIDNIDLCVVDTDYGVGILQKSNNSNKIINDNPNYSFEIFEQNKKYYLNLISRLEFYLKYIYEPIELKKKLTWLAKYDDYSSMGILSQKVLENLKNTDISCKEIIGKTETDNKLILDSIKKSINHELGIMFAYPDMINELNTFKTKVIYTGVDTTGGIPNFAENCNKADFLLTPSNTSKVMMENLGVKKPIFVFPHGVDTDLFKFKERKKSDVFKFLYVGECSDRKGIFSLLSAFTYLFTNNLNVELHIKSNTAMLFYGSDKINEIINTHKNIIWRVSNEGHEKVIELYDECNAYVYPSRADTFGMTLIEAMSCGLPIISTNNPGSTELIKGRYFEVSSKNVPVQNHPWMLGEWGEPSVTELIRQMKYVYNNYTQIVGSNILPNNSKHIQENYSWDKVVLKFEKEILPNLKKNRKVITLLTSFNRPHHIKNVINSLKDIRENDVENVIYVVENSNQENKEEILNIIKQNIDDLFMIHVSEFNLGQRGALLQLLEDINVDDYDYIQFTDQDNIFNEPISTFCDILDENPDMFFTTGYMSKEHPELGWRKTRFGNLCEKRTLRAGHMVMRISDLKSLFPIHLDSQYGKEHNSTWNAGLDWELSCWNAKSPGRRFAGNIALCVPGGVLHKGIDSTMHEWNVEEYEYKLEELINLRNKTNH